MLFKQVAIAVAVLSASLTFSAPVENRALDGVNNPPAGRDNFQADPLDSRKSKSKKKLKKAANGLWEEVECDTGFFDGGENDDCDGWFKRGDDSWFRRADQELLAARKSSKSNKKTVKKLKKAANGLWVEEEVPCDTGIWDQGYFDDCDGWF